MRLPTPPCCCLTTMKRVGALLLLQEAPRRAQAWRDACAASAS
jgi:hypothetical protein